MSILGEFNELHTNTKNDIICIGLVCPFWYLIIITFSTHFNSTQAHIELPVILSFCLSFTFFILHLATTTFWVKTFYPKVDNTIIEGKKATYAMYSVFHAIGSISFIGYRGYLNNWTFHNIVLYLYIWVLFWLCVGFILAIIRGFTAN
jgi:hypothetical protein